MKKESIFKTKVVWGEMDTFGVVNNVVYFNYLESARINFLEDCKGYEDLLSTQKGIGFVVKQSTCNYKAPLTYPDNLKLITKVNSIGNSSLHLKTSIYSENKNMEVAQGEVILVLFDFNKNTKISISDKFRKIFNDYK